jgi:hypothetical protein
MARKKEYKPLLLTTTVRNPQRYKLLLNILYAHNGKVLDNDIIDKVVFDLISHNMKNIDTNLVSIKSDVVYAITEREKLFQKWAEVFPLEVLKEELFIVSNPRENCKHEILKYISEPVRFEFLTARSLAKSYPELKRDCLRSAASRRLGLWPERFRAEMRYFQPIRI